QFAGCQKSERPRGPSPGVSRLVGYQPGKEISQRPSPETSLPLARSEAATTSRLFQGVMLAGRTCGKASDRRGSSPSGEYCGLGTCPPQLTFEGSAAGDSYACCSQQIVKPRRQAPGA